jgi:uncharacterized protein YbbK (DUF523 family)
VSRAPTAGREGADSGPPGAGSLRSMPTGPEPESALVATRPALLVSACLLGVRCNHRGEGSPSAAVAALVDRYRLVPVCPETLGGLPTPRPAAERRADGTVRTAGGDDVTAAYRRGAEAAVALAAGVGAAEAVLKARSPSCGCHEIYDGSFTRTRVAGLWVAAAALADAGLAVRSEEDVEAT